MYDFTGRISIVTGGTRGIGRETAILLDKYGSKVISSYKSNRENAEKFKMENREITLFEGDISDEPTAVRLIDFAYDKFGRVDYLVNCAGVWTPLIAGSFDVPQWDYVIKNNLRSVYLLTDYLIKKWLKSMHKGRIVNVASTAGIRGEGCHAHYAATKAAIIAYTKSLCTEISSKGIIVNCVAPGWVDTEMNKEIFSGGGKQKIADTIPIKRIPEPIEIAHPIIFLLSDYASAVSGEVLSVNGGNVLCG